MDRFGAVGSLQDEESLSNPGSAADSTGPDERFRLAPGEVSLGTIGTFDFADWYMFELTRGLHYVFTVDTGPDAWWHAEASSDDFRFVLGDGADRPDQLGSRVGASPQEQRLAFTSSVTGTHVLRIESDGARFDYAATIEEYLPGHLGTEGDDRFLDRDGDEAFDGGPGTDTLVFEAPRNRFDIDVSAGELTISRDGTTDTASSIERLVFDDGALVFLDGGGHAEEVYRLYRTALDRTPDEAGLMFWSGALDAGQAGLRDVAAFFLESAEFQASFGDGLGDAAFVDALYANLFRRMAEPEGREFWTDVLADGTLDRADVLLAFAASPENPSAAISAEDGLWVV